MTKEDKISKAMEIAKLVTDVELKKQNLTFLSPSLFHYRNGAMAAALALLEQQETSIRKEPNEG